MATTRLRTWEITDEFWAKVETYIPNDLRCPGVNYRRKPGGGRKSRYGNRLYFSAIVYVLRTGIIWNALPRKEFENITSQAVHKKFMQWSRAGFFQKLWHSIYDNLARHCVARLYVLQKQADQERSGRIGHPSGQDT